MTVISHGLLSKFSEAITPLIGLRFPESGWPELEKRLGCAAGEFGFDDTETFIYWCLSNKLTNKHIEVLAAYLTVGETYFFRDNTGFRVMEDHILPELIHSRQNGEKRLRIWSAGCSSGEEPYSIAILLRRLIPDIGDWNITILATDINAKSLKKASEGVYNEWSFRETPAYVRDRYFKKTAGSNYTILPEIKNMVTFAYLNLAGDAFPSLLNNTNAMDVIFSRNVLMYFSDSCVRKAIQGFYNSLLEGGVLLASPVDPVRTFSERFRVINFPGLIFYKKELHNQSPPLTMEIPPPLNPLPRGEGRYEGVPVISPPLEEGRFEEAAALFKTGNYAEVITKLDRLICEGNDNAGTDALMARAYANQGMLDEALKWCRIALAAEVVNPAYHFLIATVLLEKDMTEEAVRSLKNALYLDNKFVLAYFMLGNIMRQKGKQYASVRHFKNASELLLSCGDEDVIIESDGLTAGRLREIINALP